MARKPKKILETTTCRRTYMRVFGDYFHGKYWLEEKGLPCYTCTRKFRTWKYNRKTQWKQNKNMESDYKCSKCLEYTVDRYVEWGVPGTEYDEVMYHEYVCNKCGSECSVRSSEDDYEEGDFIDM